eukprot:3748887-Pyramimonas_sp.AAC.1
MQVLPQCVRPSGPDLVRIPTACAECAPICHTTGGLVDPNGFHHRHEMEEQRRDRLLDAEERTPQCTQRHEPRPPDN